MLNGNERIYDKIKNNNLLIIIQLYNSFIYIYVYKEKLVIDCIEINKKI